MAKQECARAGNHPFAPDPAADDERVLLTAILAAGRRGRAHDATGRALVAYWHWLRRSTVEARAALIERLRAAIEAGRAGPEAWVPVILGERDFGLARAATREFFGRRPVSLEWHEAVTAAARDWVQRSLALNRPAILAALLESADDASIDGLRGLCGALTRVESEAVIDACRAAHGPALQQFLDDWAGALA